MTVQMPEHTNDRDALITRTMKIRALARSITQELMKLPLSGMYHADGNKIRYTMDGIVTQSAIACLDAVRKAIDDVDNAAKRELADKMIETGQQHVVMLDTTTGAANVYDFERSRVVRQCDYDRLAKYRPEIYQELVDAGYIRITTSDVYAMRRTPSTINVSPKGGDVA